MQKVNNNWCPVNNYWCPANNYWCPVFSSNTQKTSHRFIFNLKTLNTNVEKIHFNWILPGGGGCSCLDKRRYLFASIDLKIHIIILSITQQYRNVSFPFQSRLSFRCFFFLFFCGSGQIAKQEFHPQIRVHMHTFLHWSGGDEKPSLHIITKEREFIALEQ